MHPRDVHARSVRPDRPAEPEADWRYRRRCLRCGSDHPALQAEHAQSTFRCPDCAGDLYARPARSYAELEGLVAGHEKSLAEADPRPRRWGLGALLACWRSLKLVVGFLRGKADPHPRERSPAANGRHPFRSRARHAATEQESQWFGP
jgi:hypothetical protein